jgi:hypothetical protein
MVCLEVITAVSPPAPPHHDDVEDIVMMAVNAGLGCVIEDGWTPPVTDADRVHDMAMMFKSKPGEVMRCTARPYVAPVGAIVRCDD